MNHDLQEFLLLMLAVALVACLAGCDAESSEVTAKIKAEVDEKKITFTHPLEGCTAWTVHSGTPGELPRPRCYFPRSAK